MSNTVVGSIYAQIIDKVIQASQNDFEESGIDQATLAELKENWQKRVSSYHVAAFPWDPAPVQHQIQNPPTLPSNVQKVEDSPTSASASLPGTSGGVRIKAEPDYENGSASYEASVNGYSAQQQAQASINAQQRAANLLHQQYRPDGQPIAPHGMPAPQAGFALPGQSRPTGFQLPGQSQQMRPPQQQQYPPQHQVPQQQRAPLSSAQTDGADDGSMEWSTVVAERRDHSEADRVAADGHMRAQIEQMTSRLDSGLMVPLSEHPATSSRKRKLPRSTAPSASNPSQSSTLPTIPQLDGLDDDDEDEKGLFKDEEKDEDAINSDLDDSEDELNQPVEEDEGAAVNEAILCTYDKVQRVKNKWKCTLKDGILSTKGKDYVFHKAQGEFEW